MFARNVPLLPSMAGCVAFTQVEVAPRQEMTMVSKALVVVIAAFVLAKPIFAQDATPAPAEGRYVFSRVDDGFLRLDTRTGQVSLCGRQTVGWACLTAPEDRTVLENEIGRLQRENAVLKEDLMSRGLSLPRGVMPEPQGADRRDLTLRLPDHADVDRVVMFVGRVWRRMVEVIASAQSQLLHKS